MFKTKDERDDIITSLSKINDNLLKDYKELNIKYNDNKLIISRIKSYCEVNMLFDNNKHLEYILNIIGNSNE